MRNGKNRCFIAYESVLPVGFAQCQLQTDDVEGIFAQANARHHGHATALVHACEKWAKANGYLEFARDCAIDNHVSLRFHQALSFPEASRIIGFTKRL